VFRRQSRRSSTSLKLTGARACARPAREFRHEVGHDVRALTIILRRQLSPGGKAAVYCDGLTPHLGALTVLLDQPALLTLVMPAVVVAVAA
jgi:hypothetical protein